MSSFPRGSRCSLENLLADVLHHAVPELSQGAGNGQVGHDGNFGFIGPERHHAAGHLHVGAPRPRRLPLPPACLTADRSSSLRRRRISLNRRPSPCRGCRDADGATCRWCPRPDPASGRERRGVNRRRSMPGEVSFSISERKARRSTVMARITSRYWSRTQVEHYGVHRPRCPRMCWRSSSGWTRSCGSELVSGGLRPYRGGTPVR